MNITLWAVAAILAVAMLAAGVSKLTRTRAQLLGSGNFDWAEDFTQAQIRLIGIAEILGAVGLILPAAAGTAAWLTPLAAACVALMMAGAFVVHLRRHEHNLLAPPVVLAILAGLVAILRFGPYSF